MAVHLPVLSSFSGYRLGWAKNDFAAGLAVAAVGLPSAIAYPAIAGLPPETGIYASIAPLLAYAVFGPSRQLIVGPDAATMTVLAATLVALTAGAPTVDRASAGAMLALGVGVFCIAAWALRLGVLANFLSRPILTGFFIGVSFSILIGQIKRITGVSIEADGLLRPILELLGKAALIHWPSVALAAAMFVLLQVAKALRSPIPGPVLVVALSVLLSAVLDLQGRGIAVVGDIPSGLPALSLPRFADLPFDTLVLGAAAIFLVSYGSGVITARSFGARAGYPVDANQELVGFGAANLAAGVFGAFPVSGSDSRTAVNLTVGGRTQMVSVVAAATLIATLLFLGPALRIIPLPALGAILAATAISLIDVSAMRRLWRISPMEFAFALIAMAGPIGLGVLNGVVIAIGATLSYLLSKLMFPRDALLGRVPGDDGFYKLHRTPAAQPVPGLGLCIIQGSILFFNADHVEARLRSIAEGLPADTRWLVIDASAISQIDSSAAEMLSELQAELAGRGLKLGLAELHAEARQLLERSGVIDQMGPDMVFDNLETAYRAFQLRA